MVSGLAPALLGDVDTDEAAWVRRSLVVGQHISGCAGVLMFAARAQLGFGLHVFC